MLIKNQRILVKKLLAFLGGAVYKSYITTKGEPMLKRLYITYLNLVRVVPVGYTLNLATGRITKARRRRYV